MGLIDRIREWCLQNEGTAVRLGALVLGSVMIITALIYALKIGIEVGFI